MESTYELNGSRDLVGSFVMFRLLSRDFGYVEVIHEFGNDVCEFGQIFRVVSLVFRCRASSGLHGG